METVGVISVPSPEFYRRFTAPGIFFDVREAAVRILADLLREQKSDRNRGNDEQDLVFLLNLAVCDKDPRMRHATARILAEHVPFVAGTTTDPHRHPADTDRVAAMIWTGVNKAFSDDSVMRNDFVALWRAVYGKKADEKKRKVGVESDACSTPVRWNMFKTDNRELVTVDQYPRPKVSSVLAVFFFSV
jgi:hypothetical protein